MLFCLCIYAENVIISTSAVLHGSYLTNIVIYGTIFTDLVYSERFPFILKRGVYEI